MRRFIISIFALLTFVPLAAAQTTPKETFKPVVIAVIEEESGKPIQQFEYKYSVESPSGYEDASSKWIAAKTENGEITLDMPISCHLTFAAQTPEHIYDTIFDRIYLVTTTMPERKLEYKLVRGICVSGQVLDETTKKPIADVRVSPSIFYNPSISANHARSVFTDAEGQFEIKGIMPICGHLYFEHQDYAATEWYSPDRDFEKPAKDQRTVIHLSHGETIFGGVVGEDGQPIADVVVETEDGKQVTTRPDGKFRISGVRRTWDRRTRFSIKVTKEGFMEYQSSPSSIPEDGLHIVLEPLFEIRGRVVDTQGLPVTKFKVIAGAGRTPGCCNCVAKDVDDPEGRFAIGVKDANEGGVPREMGKLAEGYWLAIIADGHAFHEQWIHYGENDEAIRIELSPGVKISGRLSRLPADFSGGTAELTPQRPRKKLFANDTSYLEEYCRISTPIAADGAFAFTHVCPYEYALNVSGRGITARTLTLTVGSENLAIDPITVRATGRIVGQVFTRDGKPWSLAKVVLGHPSFDYSCEPTIRADENGEFAFDDAPAGNVTVSAQYGGGDMIFYDTERVYVAPGHEVAVVINNPCHDDINVARFHVNVGDGSVSQWQTGTGLGAERQIERVNTYDPTFRLELTRPLDDAENEPEAISCWQCPDKDGIITIGKVYPGNYRLRVYDWITSRGFVNGLLYEGEITVQAQAAPPLAPSNIQPFEVPLGAASITGQMNVSNVIRHMPQVIAVETKGRTHPHYTRCDADGDFCVRYLPPGEYVLYCREDANGYCRLPPVRIDSDISDVGECKVAAGGTIRGTVRIASPTESPTAVHATDTNGITIEALDFEGTNGEEFAIANLWPGRWTVTLMRGEALLASKTVELKATETVAADLVVN